MGVNEIAQNSYEILMKIAGQLDPSLGSAVSNVSKSLTGISKTANTVTQNVAKGFSSIKGAVAGAVAALGVTVGFGAMMDAANSSQKATLQLQAVLKSTGGVAGVTQQAAENLALGLSSVTTFSKNAVEGSESLLLTFTKIGASVMPQATETVLNMATALGEDTKSAALQLGKSLQDPISGISALHRVGVNFTEQQKEQIKTMMKAGDVASAQGVILKELGTEFAGSARNASQSFSGEMTIVSNKVIDAMSGIGLSLMPTIQSILPKLIDGIGNVTNFITTHQPDIQKLASTISNVGQAMLTDVTPAAKTLFSLITDHGTAAKNIVLSLGAAFVGFKAISGTISVVKGVKDAIDGAGKAVNFLKESQVLQKVASIAGSVATTLWSGVTKAAAAAQWVLNAALNANPIGLVHHSINSFQQLILRLP
jgi:hypothetical protein